MSETPRESLPYDRDEILFVVRKKYSLVLGGILLALCFAIYFLLQAEVVQKNYIYPYPYQNLIRKYSRAYQIDSNLAVAVIQQESHFHPEALSHTGALGLMQLMPTTAEWISWQLDEEYSPDKILEPETNIRYGIWYLASLREEFNGNEVLMLAAYNAGRGNVDYWLHKYGWSKDFTDFRLIPFAETREYVHKVLRSKEKYERLYGSE